MVAFNPPRWQQPIIVTISQDLWNPWTIQRCIVSLDHNKACKNLFNTSSWPSQSHTQISHNFEQIWWIHALFLSWAQCKWGPWQQNLKIGSCNFYKTYKFIWKFLFAFQKTLFLNPFCAITIQKQLWSSSFIFDNQRPIPQGACSKETTQISTSPITTMLAIKSFPLL